MPIGAVPAHTGAVGEGRVTPRVVAAALTAASGGILFGFDLGVTGGVTMDEQFLQVRGREERTPFNFVDHELTFADVASPRRRNSGDWQPPPHSPERDEREREGGRERTPFNFAEEEQFRPTSLPPDVASPRRRVAVGDHHRILHPNQTTHTTRTTQCHCLTRRGPKRWAVWATHTTPHQHTHQPSQRFFPSIADTVTAAESAPASWCRYDDHTLTLFTSSAFLAAAIATLCAGSIARSAGRRVTMVAAGLAFLVGILLTAGAAHISMLILGRTLIGVGTGLANCAVPVYLSEIAPTNARGAINIAFQLATSGSILAAQLVNFWLLPGKHLWRVSVGIAAVPAAILALGALALDDSPSSLAARGESTAGRAALQRLRGADVDVSREWAAVEAAHAAPGATAGWAQWRALGARRAVRVLGGEREGSAVGWCRRPHAPPPFATHHHRRRPPACLGGPTPGPARHQGVFSMPKPRTLTQFQHNPLPKNTQRPELIVAIGVAIGSQTSGINAILFYAAPIFASLGAGSSASLLAAVAVGVALFAPTLLAAVAVDRVGRRPLMITGGLVMVATELALASVLGKNMVAGAAMSPGAARAALALMCSFVAAFALSWGPCGWLVPSEVFPLDLRAAGQAAATAANFLTVFLTTQFFLASMCAMRQWVYVSGAFAVVLSTLFVAALLPETRGVHVEEIDEVCWGRHWLWRRYSGHKAAATAGRTVAHKASGGAVRRPSHKASQSDDGV